MEINQLFILATDALQNTLPSAEEAHLAVDEGVLGTLGVNWKIFIAQLINFGIALFIFWRWIVKPLAKNLSDRQTKIEEGLKNAQHMEQERKNFDIWRQQEMKKAREQAEGIIKTASESAERSKQDIITEAKDASKRVVEQTREQIELDKQIMINEAKKELSDLVVMASEKILKEKINSQKDKELIDAALTKVK
jgi:F-type H+-transporting ATPase subunit b